MKKFNKNLIIFVVSIILISLASTSSAQSLFVEFESSPLFSESNFLPGDSVERYIKVTNSGDREKPVVTSVVNVNDPDDFAENFSIEIREDGSLLYSSFLDEFFNEDEVSLSDLGSGDQAQYDFRIFFNEGTGAEYQEKQLGFDIVIGFLGETAVGGEGGLGGGSGGDGGNFIIGDKGLQIFNESALPVNVNKAFITWQTNYPATSRVIYGTISGVFDFYSPPNYGYPFSTARFNGPASVNGLTSHLVNLSGLTPGTTYYYRVVSTASPPTISFERSFIIEVDKLLSRNGDEGFNIEDPSDLTAGVVLGQYKEEVEGFVADASEEILKEDIGADDNNLFTAQVSNLLGFSWPWWVLILILLIILYLIFKRNKKDN